MRSAATVASLRGQVDVQEDGEESSDEDRQQEQDTKRQLEADGEYRVGLLGVFGQLEPSLLLVEFGSEVGFEHVIRRGQPRSRCESGR